MPHLAALSSLGLKASRLIGPLLPHWVLGPPLPRWVLGPLLPHWVLGFSRLIWPLLPHWVFGPLLHHWGLGPLASLGLRTSLTSLGLGPFLPHWVLGPPLPFGHWVMGPLLPHWVLGPLLPHWILQPFLLHWALGPLLPQWSVGPLLPWTKGRAEGVGQIQIVTDFPFIHMVTYPMSSPVYSLMLTGIFLACVFRKQPIPLIPFVRMVTYRCLHQCTFW